MSIFNSLLSGAAGLEIETGTWTPARNTVHGEIPLNKVHDKPPVAYIVFDIGSYDSTSASSGLYFGCVDFEALLGETAVGASVTQGVYTGIYRGTSSQGLQQSSRSIGHGASDPDDSSTSYYRYYATETTLRPEVVYNAYWRTTRTYKWIAIWV